MYFKYFRNREAHSLVNNYIRNNNCINCLFLTTVFFCEHASLCFKLSSKHLRPSHLQWRPTCTRVPSIRSASSSKISKCLALPSTYRPKSSSDRNTVGLLAERDCETLLTFWNWIMGMNDAIVTQSLYLFNNNSIIICQLFNNWFLPCLYFSYSISTYHWFPWMFSCKSCNTNIIITTDLWRNVV